jgi:GTPase
MFLDQIKLTLIAGKGGNGVISWRREKYIPKGGPAGGDGGRGGHIFIEADPQLLALDFFRNKKVICSQNGKGGSGSNRKGADGEDIILKVPLGTIIKDASSEILFECLEAHQQFTICKGGIGGRGNTFFKSATQQAPYICTEGTKGEEKEIELELKLIADVGLIGMPNAGKSTFLASLTNANCKIGHYPFTTLQPNLGVVTLEDYSRLLVADIPGIIEGAHANRGLGLSFLKHIERTSLLLFLVDISAFEGRDPFEDFLLLRREIELYRKEILEKPFLVVLNKMDMENAKSQADLFKKRYPFPKKTLFELSALSRMGLPPLLQAVQELASCLKNSTPHAKSSPLRFV